MKRNRATRSKYTVGQFVELNSTTSAKLTFGTVTQVTAHMFSLDNRDVITDFLYRVEIDNAAGAFGKSTRFVFEKQIRRVVPTMAEAA